MKKSDIVSNDLKDIKMVELHEIGTEFGLHVYVHDRKKRRYCLTDLGFVFPKEEYMKVIEILKNRIPLIREDAKNKKLGIIKFHAE